MTKGEVEILGLLAGECAEFIQAKEKAVQFGIDNEYKGATNRENLQQEIGDIVALVYIINQKYPKLLDEKTLKEAIDKKVTRLRKYVKSLKDFELEDDTTENQVNE